MTHVSSVWQRTADKIFVRDYIERITLALSVVVLFSACSSSPSNLELERALTRSDPLIGKIYEIRNIQRVNGYERTQGYVLEFTAEIYILESPTEYLGRLAKSDQTGIGALAAFGLATTGLAKWGVMVAAALSAGKKGDSIPYSGKVTMIKSEQGWILRPD